MNFDAVYQTISLQFFAHLA